MRFLLAGFGLGLQRRGDGGFFISYAGEKEKCATPAPMAD